MKIREFQMSFIWTQPVRNIFDQPPPSGPLVTIADMFKYQTIFSRLRGTLGATVAPRNGPDLDPTLLQLPWKTRTGQFFWTYYLGEKPGNVSGNVALDAMVPFKVILPTKLKPTGWRGNCWVEGFLYPHGLGIIVTAVCKGEFSLEELQKTALSFESDTTFALTWRGLPVESGTLLAIGDLCLSMLQKAAYGPDAEGAGNLQPFSIVTVTHGEGVSSSRPKSGSGIHQLLHALTSWIPSTQGAPLGDIEENSLPTKRQHQSLDRVLYASPRGRAVWFPSSFKERGNILGCYHRNLVFASMQVDSLSGLASESIKALDGRNLQVLPPDHRACAKRAASLLGRLHGQDASIYHSWSVKRQLEDYRFKSDIASLRQQFGWTTAF